MLGTQTLATLIAVYGLFMTPLGWKLAGIRLGLRSGLGPRDGSRETDWLSNLRSDQSSSAGQEAPLDLTPQIALRA